MNRSIVFVVAAFAGCSAAHQAGSAGDLPSIRIPIPHQRAVVEDPGAPYPDPESVGRDPFLTRLEESPPPPPPPQPPDGPRHGGRGHRVETTITPEDRCPTSCEVTGIIEGPHSQFICGGGTYGIDDAFEGKWIVGTITAERAVLRLKGGQKTCALPFARAPSTPIEAP